MFISLTLEKISRDLPLLDNNFPGTADVGSKKKITCKEIRGGSNSR